MLYGGRIHFNDVKISQGYFLPVCELVSILAVTCISPSHWGLHVAFVLRAECSPIFPVLRRIGTLMTGRDRQALQQLHLIGVKVQEGEGMGLTLAVAEGTGAGNGPELRAEKHL